MVGGLCCRSSNRTDFEEPALREITLPDDAARMQFLACSEGGREPDECDEKQDLAQRESQSARELGHKHAEVALELGDPPDVVPSRYALGTSLRLGELSI